VENGAFLISADNKRRLDANGGFEVVTQTERRAVVKYRWVPQGDEKDLASRPIGEWSCGRRAG